MKRRVSITFAIAVAFAFGYCSAVFLQRSVNSPPSGCEARVVDSFRGSEIVEFHKDLGLREYRARFIRDNEGTRPATLAELSTYVNAKFEQRPANLENAMHDLIALDNAYETVILTSFQDIPGGTVAQVDIDLRELPFTPVHYDLDSGPTISRDIIYTWTRYQGRVKRYRFATWRDGRIFCDFAELLQAGVGEATYDD